MNSANIDQLLCEGSLALFFNFSTIPEQEKTVSPRSLYCYSIYQITTDPKVIAKYSA
jgi:hypothetical protein